MGKFSVFSKGLLKENPVLKLVLGTCPTLAVTTLAFNGIGMGLAATFVLICSNMLISALRKVIPNQVRIPAFITVIAAFVTIVQMLVKVLLPALDEALGVFLPLITVNCIILGRAEMFASKNPVLDSALDGLGMGLGFTLALTVMASVREILGAGTLTLLPGVTFQIIPQSVDPFGIMITPPGGFFIFGVTMALVIYLEGRKGRKIKLEASCSSCPAAAGCPGACEGCDGKGGE